MEQRLSKIEDVQHKQTIILSQISASLSNIDEMKVDLKELEHKVDKIEGNVYSTCDRRSKTQLKEIDSKELKMWSALGSVVAIGLLVVVYMNEVHVDIITTVNKIDKSVVILENNQKHMTSQIDKIADVVLDDLEETRRKYRNNKNI